MPQISASPEAVGSVLFLLLSCTLALRSIIENHQDHSLVQQYFRIEVNI